MRAEARARVVATARLPRAVRTEMFGLFRRHFEGVDESTFAADLEDKHWALLLRDDEGLAGFTSFRYERLPAGGALVSSGDTLVAPRAWASSLLAPAWIGAVSRVHRGRGGGDLFWLLLVSGFRTYRFLPTFFRTFYPRFDRATPPRVQTAIDRAARRRYGAAFLDDLGIVRFERPQILRPALRAVPDGRRRNPHVEFFVRRNPGAERGDELVCWTRIDRDNLTPAGRRMVGRSLGAAGLDGEPGPEQEAR